MRKRGSRRLNYEELEVENWNYPDEGALSEDALNAYKARKTAVELYLSGATEQEIKEKAGLGISQTYRLIRERCLIVHKDGLVWGWRGLVKSLRINPYQRKHKVTTDRFGFGTAGALTAVLNEFPDLRERFNRRILKPVPSKKLGEVKRSVTNHWKWFLEELRDLYAKNELNPHEQWPFDTEKQGYFSIWKYVRTLYAENPRTAALLVGGPTNQKKMDTGDGTNRPVTRLFQRVEMDAHKIDGRFCVHLPQQDGSYLPKIIHRLWVIVILEVISRAVVGYHFSMRKEVSKYDVLRSIKCALTPWKKPTLSFSEIAYHPRANLPSSMSDEFIGICWDETSVDGALAETCKHVATTLKNVVGSEVLSPHNSFSASRNMDDRPYIETFFRTIGQRGFQRLSNTTGSKPADKNGRDPDAVALTSEFQIEYAEELLAALIANYNAHPHSSLGRRSPLEYLEFHAARLDQPLRHADKNSVDDLVSYRKLCTVRGGYKEGRRPYVNFAHARYTGDTLAQRHDLVGQKIWVNNHIENDIRVVRASKQDGQPLGVLRVGPPWHKLPHSLEVRNSVANLIKTKKLQVAGGADAIEVFLYYVESQGNNKLPVHPMYLEARRILALVAEGMLGKSMLVVAKERAEQEKASVVQQRRGPQRILVQEPISSQCLSKLPPPRKAANK